MKIEIGNCNLVVELECGIEGAPLKTFEGPYFGVQGRKKKSKCVALRANTN